MYKVNNKCEYFFVYILICIGGIKFGLKFGLMVKGIILMILLFLVFFFWIRCLKFILIEFCLY